MYAAINRTSKYREQNMREIKKDTDKSSILRGDFNRLLSIIGKRNK